MFRTPFVLSLILLIFGNLSRAAYCQDSDADSGAKTSVKEGEVSPGKPENPNGGAGLPAQVRQLVAELQDRKLETRDRAEAKLLSLGPTILSHLPPIDERTSGETKQRLLRIREILDKQRQTQATHGSRVTLKGKFPLSAILKEFEAQTGNTILDYRSRFNQDPTDGEFEVNFGNIPYWEALDTLLDQASLSLYNFVGEDRRLAIIAKTDESKRIGQSRYHGLFRIEPVNVVAEKDYRNTQADALRLGLELAWEPRATPILITHNLDQVQAEADNGDALPLSMNGEMQIPVQDGVATIDLRIPLSLPSRDVRTIRSLKGTIGALVPGAVETFEFPNIAQAAGEQKRVGGITVVIDRVRRNGEVQEISVRIRFDDAQDALQSHLDWVSNNEVILVGPDGQTADEPSMEEYLRRDNEIGYSYLYTVENLKGYKLIYKSPAGITETRVDYELHDIQLP